MKTKNRFSNEFKAQAVELAGLGKPIAEVAEDLGISRDLIYRWKRESEAREAPQLAQGGSEGHRAVGEVAGADELRKLRREVAHLKMENDILKKAAVILGTTLQPRIAL